MDAIRRRHRGARGSANLISNWLRLYHLAGRGLQQKIALWRIAHGLHTVELHSDDARIRSCGDDKVVLQFLPVSVINHIHARPNAVIADLSKGRDSSNRQVSNKVRIDGLHFVQRLALETLSG